ncbi:MAG: restriction endonuclease subunit S [Methyloglobulus sp.]
MSEWREGTLAEIATIIMGQSPEGESCNANGNGSPLLNGPTEFGVKYPVPVQFTVDPKKFSEPNDILFCVRGSTTGRTNWADQIYALGRGLASIRHKEGQEFRYFVRGIIDFNLPLLLASATGSTFPNVSRNQLEELEISIPPLREQKTIAAVLSSLDDKIDLLTAKTKPSKPWQKPCSGNGLWSRPRRIGRIQHLSNIQTFSESAP